MNYLDNRKIILRMRQAREFKKAVFTLLRFARESEVGKHRAGRFP